MTLIVPRTCTEEISAQNGSKSPKTGPLPDWQQAAALILLGQPGAGKSSEFRAAAASPEAFYVTARDLITFKDLPEWHNKTLFIDGLDEIRAGAANGRTPFDEIRACLHNLGRPKFRLSCREADWFGTTDKHHLLSVSHDATVIALHLNPLTTENVIMILGSYSNVTDPEKFVAKARDLGIHDLLFNPQALDMLTKAVTNGTWPETREQTFDMACHTIIREHNAEHASVTDPSLNSIDGQLNAAGYLSAIQLISGFAGFALQPTQSSATFPSIGEVIHDNPALLIHTAKTKLFHQPDDQHVATPVHRQVAEYLAARYLSKQIDAAGLPPGRVLALITSEDGAVVSELRGLAAWLATVNIRARQLLIDHDPLGTILYGDVRNFTRTEKRLLLNGLKTAAIDDPWFRTASWTDYPFGALATADMAEEFKIILCSNNRDSAHQAVTNCVLDAMHYGDRFNFDWVLINLIADETWWGRIRYSALKLLCHTFQIGLSDANKLATLLKQVHSGTVEDSNDELLGLLLTTLYPKEISAKNIVNYLHQPKQDHFGGKYRRFITDHLIAKSSAHDIKTLIDEFAARLGVFASTLQNRPFPDLVYALINKGLAMHGNQIDSEQLYSWLGIAAKTQSYYGTESKLHKQQIRAWLAAHPDQQKKIILTHFAQVMRGAGSNKQHYQEQSYLLHAARPSDFGPWCLQQMQTMNNDEAERYLLQQAFFEAINNHGTPPFSIEKLQLLVHGNPTWVAWLEQMISPPDDPQEREFEKKQRLLDIKNQEEKSAWVKFAKESLETHGNHPPQKLLLQLGQAYFGYLHHSVDELAEAPMENLSDFLDSDSNLLATALSAMRNSIAREDLPNVKGIIDLIKEGRIPSLGYPVLAGLEERQKQTLIVPTLSDDQLRRATAIRLAVNIADDPSWYTELLLVRPELVAEVMTAFLRVALKTQTPHIDCIYSLAQKGAYDGVARKIILKTLGYFPIRSSNDRLNILRQLLGIALDKTPNGDFLDLINKKLNHKSMNVGQRCYWLATGLLLAPDEYLQPVKELVNHQKHAIQHLAEFFARANDPNSSLKQLPTEVVAELIRLIGATFAPYRIEGTDWVSPAMATADLISGLIQHLGTQTDSATSTLIEELLNDTNLEKWRPRLDQARVQQRAAWREATFSHPTLQQTCDALLNLAPANVADLAALTVELLNEVADITRHGDTNNFDQYWQGSRSLPQGLGEPKHENDCRNVLLDKLRGNFGPLGVTAEPEGSYTNDKRADIKLGFGGTNGIELPIEIKKNSHTDLWRAIHTQLIPLYTNEPKTGGFGIYLVFWFGADKTYGSLSGVKPRNATDLKKLLITTLSAEEKRKISICVIDVSDPRKQLAKIN